MVNFYNPKKWQLMTAGVALLSLACVVSGPGTAIPAGRPASFELQIATPTLDPEQITAEAEPVEAEPAVILPLSDAPTHTPVPDLQPSLPTLPPDTPTPEPTEEIEPEPTETPTILPATATPQEVDLDPPRQGGDWDFETNFDPWANPYGEPCPGAAVASGWTAFVEQGEFGSSCMNENQYQPNVFSGLKSQEITFDFIATNSGVFRTIPTKVGHRYQIVAYAKHDRSLTPVQMFLGVDLSGGTVWNAETVEWFPWNSALEDTWVSTEETVTATGERMTIFIRGLHPVAEQGGKTVIDNVSVKDLGL